jgi:dTDP-4-amino-4,6-dideoxygalactose transaminase
MTAMMRPSKFIPFARPSFTEEEEHAVAEVLRGGWVSTGRAAEELEEAFERKLECRFARAVNSATAGLHLAVKALGIRENDYVITTPFTFTSTAEIIRYENAHPLFVDIREDSFNIDPELTERALKRDSRVTGIIPVHIAGRICGMEALLDLRKRFGVPIIEDAAHAFPVKNALGWAGTLGDIGVFSFYATKPITTGEGGMVVSNSEDLARAVGVLRLHGIDRSVWDRYHAKTSSWEYDVIAPGYKYNLSDILAAIGVVQMKKADVFLKRRREIARNYLEGLRGEDYLLLPEETDSHAWHLFILRILPDRLTINRDEFLHLLSEADIGVSLHFRPLHLMSYYRKAYDLKPDDFPVSLSVYRTCFSIPLYYGLTDDEVAYIIRMIRKIGRKHRKKV